MGQQCGASEVKIRVVAKILQERGDMELYAALNSTASECEDECCSLDGDDASDLFHDLLIQRMAKNSCTAPYADDASGGLCGTGLMWDEHNAHYEHSHSGGTTRDEDSYGVSMESIRPENLNGA